MDKKEIERKAANGMVWQMSERVSCALIQFVLSVVLARLVLPEEYGIISLISVFIAISDLLVNAGFGTALIQKKSIDEQDVVSVFTFSTFAAIVVWGILCIVAPQIAAFYKEPLITPVLRVYGMVLWPSAIMGMLRSLLMREMEFKKVFFSSIIPLVISGIAGVIIALLGGGVYALIGQALINAIGGVINLEIMIKWKPHMQFCKTRILNMWKYSWKLVLANIIDTGYRNLYTLCISKVFGNKTLGYYSYGRQIPNVVVSTINSSVVSVMFPVFSKNQDNIGILKANLRKTLRLCNFFIFPVMLGIAVLADSVIIILLGNKWIQAAWYLQFFCIAYGLQHIQNINFQAISACGRSEVYLKYEMIKKAIGIITLVITLPLGMKFVMYGQVFNAVVFVLLNVYPNKKWFEYTIKEQMKDIIPFVFITFIMCICVELSGTMLAGMNLYVKVLCQIIVGVAVYCITAIVFRIDELGELFNLIKNRIKINKER